MRRRAKASPLWSDVTALFGGRFDPPHLSHRQAVRGLFKNPGIKEVLIIPSASPPHKPTLVSAEHRLEMAKLNFLTVPHDSMPPEIRIHTCELDRARKKPERASYSFDTLQELRSSYSKLAFVIGTDQLEQFHTWHRFPEILTLCHWIVLARKPSGELSAGRVLEQWANSGLLSKAASPSTWQIKLGNAQSFLQVVSTEAIELSSTKIRESLVLQGRAPSGALFEPVEAYLKSQRLYGI